MSYEVRRIDPAAHAEAVSGLIREVLGLREAEPETLLRDFSHPRWPCTLHGLFQDGEKEPIGVLVVRPMPWRFGEVERQVRLLGDWAVAPAHRTLFPALLLARAALETALRDDGIVTGFPNAAAEPVLLRSHARLERLGEMRRFVRPLLWVGYLQDRMNRVAGRWLLPLVRLESHLRRVLACLRARGLKLELMAPDGCGDLPVTHMPGGLMHKPLTAEFVRWRFGLFSPGRFLIAVASDRQGRHAIAVLEREADVLHLRDLSWDEGFPLERLPALLSCRLGTGLRSLSCSLLDNVPGRMLARRLGMVAREVNRPFVAAVPEGDAAADPNVWLVTDGCEDR